MIEYILTNIFTLNTYGIGTVQEQISVELLLWAHLLPAIIGLVFTHFIWWYTKKLSALYLFLSAFAFAMWSFLSLFTWLSDITKVMFAWSIWDIFYTLFVIFLYWFFYTFIKKNDVPLTHKILSVLPLVPVYTYILLSKNFDTVYVPNFIALEKNSILFYLPTITVIFMIAICHLAYSTYKSSPQRPEKMQIILATSGVLLSVFITNTSLLVSNIFIYFNLASTSESYNLGVYSLFGMPFLILFLGYLIARYQAFSIVVTRSIGYVLILMLILFINIFI